MKSFLKRLFSPEDTTPLCERVEEVERQFKRLDEEWTDVYSKFRVMQMRVAKQVQRLDESSQEEPQGTEGRELSVVNGGPLLSPTMQRIQNQILSRRRGIPVKGGE